MAQYARASAEADYSETMAKDHRRSLLACETKLLAAERETRKLRRQIEMVREYLEEDANDEL